MSSNSRTNALGKRNLASRNDAVHEPEATKVRTALPVVPAVPKSPVIIRPVKSLKELRPSDVFKITSPVQSPIKSPKKDSAYTKQKITEPVIAALDMEFGMTKRVSNTSGIVYGKIDIVKLGGQLGQLTLFSLEAVDDFIHSYTELFDIAKTTGEDGVRIKPWTVSQNEKWLLVKFNVSTKESDGAFMHSENDPTYGRGEQFEMQYSASRNAQCKAIPKDLRPRPCNLTAVEVETYGDIDSWIQEDGLDDDDVDQAATSNSWDALLEI